MDGPRRRFSRWSPASSARQVIGDVSDAVSQYAMAVFSGEDPATALEALLASLKTARPSSRGSRRGSRRHSM